MDDGRSQEEYIRQVLEAYRKTPGTTGTVRRPDRMLAAQLYQRGVAVSVIENAFVLAVARRLMHPAVGHDSFAGLFPSRDRGSARHACQPGLLPARTPQARTDRQRSVDPARAFGADDGILTRTP